MEAKSFSHRLGCAMQDSIPCYHCSPVGLIPEPFSFLIFRNEFRPWIDVKPVKAIKAKPQYKPPEEKMTHETSYSAQFKGETSKPSPADNKYLERRRIRTLYSEPYKEPPKVRNTAEGTQGHHCSWWDMSNTVRLEWTLLAVTPPVW